LLIPFLLAGLDVDGCDISPDMLSLCRARAEREGFKPHLYQQALHELALPRSYQTIVACGALGLGSSRQQDFIALQRFYQHLKLGGVLLLDHYLPYGDTRAWQFWQKESRDQLPEPWPDTIGKTPPDEGTDYELHTTIVAFDPLEQQVTRKIRALLWRDSQLIEEEEYTLSENFYFRNELRQMLEQVGFEIEAIRGDHTTEEATMEHDVIVFIARK
jgi:SAM-dependent methyltransferase